MVAEFLIVFTQAPLAGFLLEKGLAFFPWGDDLCRRDVVYEPLIWLYPLDFPLVGSDVRDNAHMLHNRIRRVAFSHGVFLIWLDLSSYHDASVIKLRPVVAAKSS